MRAVSPAAPEDTTIQTLLAATRASIWKNGIVETHPQRISIVFRLCLLFADKGSSVHFDRRSAVNFECTWGAKCVQGIE